MSIDADRWLEIDLYWFNRQDIDGSVREFWHRFAPLMEGIDGWKGVIVNAGWLVDHVMAWNGNLDERIPFPAGLVKDKFFTDTSPLLGTEAERKHQWKERFESRADHDGESYPDWTYGQFAVVAESIRVIGADVFGIDNVRVGTFVIGWNSIYHCDFSPWSERHPEAFFKGPWVDQLLNVPALLTADATPYAAYPDGIADGTPLTEFFGRQWGALSRDLRLDAIVLRDSMIGQGIYERVGPWGATGPEDPADVIRWSEATADLVRQTKLAAPDALVIGYSNAASAVADWRVNCVDLESIAREGHLDAWIDQTWAGAWNEVGAREDIFWNLPLQGWTNQLGFVLMRAAILAGTPTRHYVLTETFDAWESWDIIHTAPSRLAWGIWAYLHAFVKTPTGLVAPRGTYISWLNQGKRLLSEGDVAYLAQNINEATLDARGATAVDGPTLVYARDAMSHMNATRPEVSIKEWADEQAGFLAKFSVPVSSATRIEYLPSVDSDLFYFSTPVHLTDADRTTVVAAMDAGRPLVIAGSPAGGIDPVILERAGVATDSDYPIEWVFEAVRVSERHADLPDSFAIRQHWSSNTVVDDVDVVYSVQGSAVLIRRGNVLLWDPCDVKHRLVEYSGKWDFGRHAVDESTPDLMGSPFGYVMAAREINRLLREAGCLSVSPRAWDDTMAVTAWVGADGHRRVLVGEMEEGFRASTEGEWVTRLSLPGNVEHTVALRYGEAALITVRGVGVVDTHRL
ncbi:hypothetical protein [Microcella sp.]|uniref:hypothetical protein n=1 Tax=Microcella sp. TaxID=1913979 RepID=UPI003F71764B